MENVYLGIKRIDSIFLSISLALIYPALSGHTVAPACQYDIVPLPLGFNGASSSCGTVFGTVRKIDETLHRYRLLHLLHRYPLRKCRLQFRHLLLQVLEPVLHTVGHGLCHLLGLRLEGLP